MSTVSSTEITTQDPVTAWNAVLGSLEVSIPKANFQTWFKSTRILHASEDHLTLGVPNTFTQEWLQNKYHDQILAALQEFYPALRQIIYKVANAGKPLPATASDASTLAHAATSASTALVGEAEGLNPHYTFDTFVVGTNNRLAHAAAVAVAGKLGAQRYNPLYFYGGVGLGKTHLMQAIGNEVKRRDPRKTVLYAPCEKFASEFVEALQTRKMDQFKRRYRNADVLLIDDIQFLTKKETTQEEFFHTFNALHQTGRQIVMTSDARPQSIPQLAPRLSSRFGWGMVADIASPDVETRQAILRHKCLEKGYALDDESLEYIAKNVQHNIRELEGTLNSIMTHCELYNVPATPSLVQQLLEQQGIDRRNVHLSAETIFSTVADFFSLDVAEILGKRRQKELVHPRQIAMYLMRHEMNFSFPKIGKALGGKDHTTVMHGVLKITKALAHDESLQRDLSLLKERLYAGT